MNNHDKSNYKKGVSALWQNEEALQKYLTKLKELMYERRMNLQTNHPVELAIRNIVHEVEKLGAHEVLTNAVLKLDEARNEVAYFIDWHPELLSPQVEQVTGKEDWVSEMNKEGVRNYIEQLTSEIESLKKDQRSPLMLNIAKRKIENLEAEITKLKSAPTGRKKLYSKKDLLTIASLTYDAMYAKEWVGTERIVNDFIKSKPQ